MTVQLVILEEAVEEAEAQARYYEARVDELVTVVALEALRRRTGYWRGRLR